MWKLIGYLLLVLVISCAPNDPINTEESNKEIPHYIYQKLGANWYKLPTGSLHPNAGHMVVGDPGRPRDQWLRDQVIYHEHERFRFVEGPLHLALRYYFPNIDNSLAVDGNYMMYLGWMELSTKPKDVTHTCVPANESYGWGEYSQDFQVLTDGYKCLRSVKPVFFDQHIYLQGTPQWSAGQMVGFSPRWASTFSPRGESEYPFLSSEFGLGKGSMPENQYLLKVSDVFQSIVEAIYIGPELPENVSREVQQ